MSIEVHIINDINLFEQWRLAQQAVKSNRWIIYSNFKNLQFPFILSTIRAVTH